MYLVFKHLDWATIVAGQLATPVSYELQTDVADLETINYSQFVGIANRDRGVGINIPFKNVNARLAAWVLNGTGGINGAIDDIDDRSNFGAMFEMTPVEPLSFKVFANLGNLSDNTGLLPGSVGTNLTEMDVDAYGAGVNYKSGPVHLFGEYVQAKIKITDEVTSARLSSSKTREWYVHGSYAIPDTDLQLVARYDKYDPNTAVTNDDMKVTTAGLNWNFDKNARVQIMREFNKGADNDDLDIQLTVKF
jgi:predicted porin